MCYHEIVFPNKNYYLIRKEGILMQLITLTTPRLVLCPFSIQDADDLFPMLSDRDTCYDDGGYEPFSRDKKYTKLMETFAAQEGRYVIHLANSDKTPGKAIGMIHLMDNDRAVPSYEIGYVLNKDYRRRGYASEAVNAVIDFCFANGIEMITASAGSFNQISQQMLLKLGFEQEGVSHKAEKHPIHGIVDSINFYLMKKE